MLTMQCFLAIYGGVIICDEPKLRNTNDELIYEAAAARISMLDLGQKIPYGGIHVHVLESRSVLGLGATIPRHTLLITVRCLAHEDNVSLEMYSDRSVNEHAHAHPMPVCYVRMCTYYNLG